MKIKPYDVEWDESFSDPSPLLMRAHSISTVAADAMMAGHSHNPEVT